MQTQELLVIKIRDKFDKRHTLKYYFWPTPLKKKYIELFNKNKENPDHSFSSYFNNKLEEDLPQLSTQLKELTELINQKYDFMQLPIYDTFDNEQLNILHAKFEEWEILRRQFKIPKIKTLEQKMLSLNELIHQFEQALAQSTTKSFNMHEQAYYHKLTAKHDYMGAILDIQPVGLFTDIEEKDKILLTTQYHWGGLYLGYNTLGKDYMSVCTDNDIRAIENDEVKPQCKFAAEIWLNFGMDAIVSSSFDFSSWYATLPKHLQNKIPVDNLNALTLGRFPLGNLYIDDQFYEIDNNLDHWRARNHYCKKIWNKEVFSTFREIEDISIIMAPSDEVNQFVNQSEDQQWMPDKNKPPSYLWESDWPWAPVFIDFDEKRSRKELEEIDKFFVPHRDNDGPEGYGHYGWLGVTLHGIGPTKTENYDQYNYETEEQANYHWTSICKYCPYIVKVVKSLPYKKFGRVRIMKLRPGGYIMPHNDGDGRIFGPLNLALTNPPNCNFYFENKGIVPFAPGRGFILDLGIKHCVLNYSEENRYHLIIHGEFTNEISSLIERSLGKL